MEAASMGKSAYAGSYRSQLESGYVSGSFYQGVANVVDFVFVEPEAVAPWVFVGAFVRWVFDYVLQVIACEFEEFFEYGSGFFLV